MPAVLIGLGSNVDPGENLQNAARRLRGFFPGIAFSSAYRTAPLHAENQPPFLNAVARVETEDAPETVLEKLQEIERGLKKDPPYRFGPRTIDLDLLLYDDQRIVNERVNVPHGRMHERRFVLEPLCELVDRTERHPVLGRTWAELLLETRKQECERMTLVL